MIDSAKDEARDQLGSIATRISAVAELLNKKFDGDADVAQLRSSVVELIDLTRRQSSMAARTEAIETPKPEVDRSMRQVLYIEDNPVNFGLIADTFRELRPKLAAHRAITGREGIDIALTIKPDLILLDLNLPDMHGSQLLDVLQQNPATALIPVVILSADATPYRIERLLSAGARNYLIKPFDLMQFLAVIDDIFEEPASEERKS
jgi:CheY-like chemotaxis protein